MTNRRRISARDRETLLERERGLCHLCGLHVDVGQAWDVSHEIPLACGGADDETNRRCAHRRCHRAHTAAVDAPWIAKTRRQRQAHNGAKESAGTIHAGSCHMGADRFGGGGVRRVIDGDAWSPYILEGARKPHPRFYPTIGARG